MSEEIKKKLWRYCPFSWYDTEYLQRWLEKQAAKGNFLSGSGFIGHFAIMKKDTPRQMRYQSISALPKTSNDNDMVHMIEDMGWHLVCSARNTDIYATENINAPDLHSDTAIEILDLKRIKQHIFFLFLLGIIMWPGISICFRLFDYLHFDGTFSSYQRFYLCDDIIWFFLLTINYLFIMHSFKKHKYALEKHKQIVEQEYNRYRKVKNLQRGIMSCTVIILLVLSIIIPNFHLL